MNKTVIRVQGKAWEDIFNSVKDGSIDEGMLFNHKLTCINNLRKKRDIPKEELIRVIDRFDVLDNREEVIKLYKEINK